MFVMRKSDIKLAVAEVFQERDAYARARIDRELAEQAEIDARKREAEREAERYAARELACKKNRQNQEKQIAESRQRKLEKQKVNQCRLEARPSYKRRLERYDMIKNLNPADLAKRNEEIESRKRLARAMALDKAKRRKDRALALEMAERRKKENESIIQPSSEVVAAEVVAAENTKKRNQMCKCINIKWFKKLAFWK